MATYHLYELCGNELVGSADIEAADDAEAARLARQRADGKIVEIWRGGRRVRVVATARPIPTRASAS